MRSVIGYIRVSTGKQAVHGVSLEAQRERIAAYCTLHDLELVEVLEDASSAKSIEGRPAMKELLRLARSGAIDGVVCCKLDRMFRNTVEAVSTINELAGLKCAVHIIDMGGNSLDTSSPMGGFFVTMVAAFAELERKQIGERTRAALAHKRDTGRQYSATAPYGWQYIDGALVEHPSEMHVVEAIFNLKNLGYGPTAIADKLLMKENYKPRLARVWSPSTVANILKHPLNVKKYQALHAAQFDVPHGEVSSFESEGEKRVQH